MQNITLEHEDFAQHMGAESHSPPIWGKDQDTSLAYKATTTPRAIQLTSIQIILTNIPETFGLHQWG